jgi:hypothetical protein
MLAKAVRYPGAGAIESSILFFMTIKEQIRKNITYNLFLRKGYIFFLNVLHFWKNAVFFFLDVKEVLTSLAKKPL